MFRRASVDRPLPSTYHRAVVRLGFLLVGALLSSTVALATSHPVLADVCAAGGSCFFVQSSSAASGATVKVSLGSPPCQGAEIGFSGTSPSGRIHRSVKLHRMQYTESG